MTEILVPVISVDVPFRGFVMQPGGRIRVIFMASLPLEAFRVLSKHPAPTYNSYVPE